MATADQDATIVWKPAAAGRLVVQRGPQAGASFPLLPGEAVVGRGEASDILLHDPMTSRRHARLAWQAGRPFIEDLGSSNGTFVNNAQVAGRHLLHPGDKITVGQTLLLYQTGDAEPPPPPLPAAPTELKKALPAGRGAVSAPGVAARRVIVTAEQTNRRLGHENLGFLSEAHGVMPATPPALRLPPGYEGWDDTAAALPDLYRTLRVRPALEDLPLLSAAADDLPDTYLLRASCIISMLAHAYYRIEANPPETPLPESIRRPWEEIARRLKRPAPHLSYIDLIMYNWRLVVPERADPMRVDNMRLLVPTVDNREENIFYLTQVEILAQCTPVIAALVRAQEAAQRDDPEALEQELALIADGLQHVTFRSFMTIDPNRYGHSYVDPVVWAKTVAPFAVPIQAGVAGPSGTSAPIFHLLDVFFGRGRYDSRFGVEMIHLRDWYPKHWQDLLAALDEVSVADYVERRGAPRLHGMYKEAVQAYVGNSGFLSRHRLKVYGYLDIAFKVGRSVTITGFSGLFKDRTWDQVDHELADARQERQDGFPQSSHAAAVKRVETINPAGHAARWVRRVVLDVSDSGLRYRPGDRVAVLPENGEALIDKTLAALQARGDESIPLTSEWRAAIDLREGYQGARTLPLRAVLKFGRIRPVDRAAARALYASSMKATLRRIVEARAEDQWELWDLLELLRRAGFDPQRLWKAHPGEREHICRIVAPETLRMYSISSSMSPGAVHASLPVTDTFQQVGGSQSGFPNLFGARGAPAAELHLTIGRLLYETRESDVSAAGSRLGTASHFLGDRSPAADQEAGRVALQLVRPPRFGLPADPSVPVVMIAGGTGISPFRGFILERAYQPKAGETWLFFSTRDRAEFYYREELESIVAQGRLHVHVAFSRDPVEAHFVAQDGGGQFVFEPGENRHIGDEMLREENARLLWDLLRSRRDGGRGAYLYVCGRTGFAKSVMEAVREILKGDQADLAEQEADEMLYRLVGEGRYQQDVFTTYTAPHMEVVPSYDASQLVLHNDAEAGYWMALNGRVYDVTRFAHMHPGGFKVMRGYTGMDATRAYRKVLHHANPEVDSMLGMFEIGAMRRLDFGMEWGMAIGPRGLQFVSLADAYRAWVRFLYTLVEMQNALDNDYTLRERAMTGDEDPAGASPLKLQFLLEVHERFLLNYVEGSLGQPLEDLWAVTSGACQSGQDVRWMRDAIQRIQTSQEAGTVRRMSGELATRICDVAARGVDEQDAAARLVVDSLSMLEREDRRFLHEMKMSLRAGVQVFEAHEREAIRQGGEQLMTILKDVPRLLEAYHARVLAGALQMFVMRDE